jgi:hypothetical protein
MNPLKNHVSDELLHSLGDIRYRYVESEHPDHHWNLMKIKDETILDLGCGFHLIEPGWESTPEYFINRGAKKVVGVDPNCQDIHHLKSMYPNENFYCDKIDSVKKLDYFIENYNITSLKMDIEGFEINLIQSNSTYPSLNHVAIETHSRLILNSMIRKLISLKFNIDTVCVFYPEVYNICNLIYASRIKN